MSSLLSPRLSLAKSPQRALKLCWNILWAMCCKVHMCIVHWSRSPNTISLQLTYFSRTCDNIKYHLEISSMDVILSTSTGGPSWGPWYHQIGDTRYFAVKPSGQLKNFEETPLISNVKCQKGISKYSKIVAYKEKWFFHLQWDVLWQQLLQHKGFGFDHR